jgi:hypothetical protein
MSPPRRRRTDSLWDRVRPLLAYLLIAAVTFVGFIELEMNDAESVRQRERLCDEAKVSREALRQVYKDVAMLGRNLTAGSPPERRGQVRELIDTFEEERLASLPPIDGECK